MISKLFKITKLLVLTIVIAALVYLFLSSFYDKERNIRFKYWEEKFHQPVGDFTIKSFTQLTDTDLSKNVTDLLPEVQADKVAS